MMPGNLGQLTNKVSYLVNFNSGQTDQDFRGPAAYANQRIHDSINEAYIEECVLGKQNGSRDWFRREHSMTWIANSATMAIPEVVRDRDIEAIRDDTDTTGGILGPLVQNWDGLHEGSGIWRQNAATWGWHPTPGAAKTLTIVYVAEPVELVGDGDVPDLIPTAYRDLLVWSSGVILKMIADETAPRPWLERREMLRYQYWKNLESHGQPRQFPGARVRNPYGDAPRSV